jgi:hypothetical protein
VRLLYRKNNPLWGAAILPYLPFMGFWDRFSQKLFRSVDDVRSENLRNWVSSLPDVTPIEDARPRTRCRVAGIIQNIRIDPRPGSGYVEATIHDGTANMVARWLGRSSLSGVRLGAGLIVEGIPGVGEHEEPVILNPEYQLTPGPEHG